MKFALIENALNLFFPPSCGFCNKIGNSYLCEYCSDYLKTRLKNKVSTYDDKFFSTHFWFFEYKDEVRDQIINYKFNDASYLYRTFTQIILNNKKACEYIESFDIIVPIPIHNKRKKYRGYNQSELIAKKISNTLNNIELKTNLIKKVINIKPQSTLTKNERIENVKNAYELVTNEEDYTNKKILIFDDVYTTGSTANECAKILFKLNCKEIGLMTLAKN